MVRQHHQFNGHEFEQTPGDSGGQRSMMCCNSQGCKELDTAQRLNSNDQYCVCVNPTLPIHPPHTPPLPLWQIFCVLTQDLVTLLVSLCVISGSYFIESQDFSIETSYLLIIKTVLLPTFQSFGVLFLLLVLFHWLKLQYKRADILTSFQP